MPTTVIIGIHNFKETLKDLWPELHAFLIKMNVGKSSLPRYWTSLKLMLKILEEKKMTFSDIRSDDFKKAFTRKSKTRRICHLKMLHNFLSYKGLFKTRLATKAQQEETALQKGIGAFYHDLKARGYKAATLQRYNYSLNSFLSFCLNDGLATIDAFSRETIDKYMTHLFIDEKDRYQTNTRIHMLYEIKTFLRYLFEAGHTLFDLGSYLEMPKQEKKMCRNLFKREELAAFFKAIDTSTLFGFMDRTMFEIFYATGIRAGELCNLCLQDVNLNEKTLLIREGKGAKDRVVPLTRTAFSYLKLYLADVRPRITGLIGRKLGADCSDRLFLQKTGRGMPKETVTFLVRKYARLAGIRAHRSSHAFRYSCATHMLENGADIRHIAELLGHRNVNTTGAYTRVLTSNLKEAITHHPRDRQGKGIVHFKPAAGRKPDEN